MAPILIALLAIVAALLGYRWAQRQPPAKRWKAMMIIVGLVLLIMVATGRMHWLFAVIGAAIPALQRLLSLAMYAPTIQRAFRTFGGNKPKSGNTSEVETMYLKMQLDHDSGKLSGVIKSGTHAGQSLHNLSLQQLQDLYEEYARLDEDSRLLLQNYIDRTHGTDWHASASTDSTDTSSGISSKLSIDEAYAILGLQSGASREEIINAHKSLIQKLHPDRGGSSYLATKINQAKDLLLKHNE